MIKRRRGIRQSDLDLLPAQGVWKEKLGVIVERWKWMGIELYFEACYIAERMTVWMFGSMGVFVFDISATS